MDYEVKRLDHLGMVTGIIKDLNIVENIDKIVGKDAREEISTGECVAAMIINGLGFTGQPLSLTEKFFEKEPLELLLGRDDIDHSHFSRSRLSRALDKL